SAALATQAVLTLLLATAPDDAKNPQYRHTTVPSSAVNRLAAAGLLVRAVHELPAPAPDLVAPADPLCNYVRRPPRPDGSLTTADNPADARAESSEGDDLGAAEALHGLVRSQQRGPAPWKLEAVRKALPCYHARWRARKTPGLASALTAAWAEAYALTRE